MLTADLTVTAQNGFILDQGLLDVGSHTLTVNGAVGGLVIGDGSDAAMLTGTGTVAANMAVNNNGTVAPGEPNTLGTLEIDGGISFNGGSQLLVSLGATPDLLHVTGGTNLAFGTELTIASGQLSNSTPQPVLTADGGLTGTFNYTATPIDLAGGGIGAITVHDTANAVQLQQAPVNLAIEANTTNNIAQTDLNGVRTFTAQTDDAVLNISDIQAALQAGLNVVISTGSSGGSPGNIFWFSDAGLDYSGLGTHSLTLQTDSLDTSREVDIEAAIFDSASTPRQGISYP